MADLNALLVFAKVVEAESFSKAALRLGMPVSTVSRRIAELENRLGVRLLERSTRQLRLTDVGTEMLEHARRSVELGDAVDRVVSQQQETVQGTLRLSAPPSIAHSLLAPLVTDFQATYPEVRVQILVTDRFVDHISEGVDLVLRVGPLEDSGLVARRILRYRHLLVASPDYLACREAPSEPKDLLGHRLLAFSFWSRRNTWTFQNSEREDSVRFEPHMAMNDYHGLATASVSGAGICDLPPIVCPELIASGQLVEVMPRWRFRPFDLSIVHLGSRHVPRAVQLFKDFVARSASTLFETLPD